MVSDSGNPPNRISQLIPSRWELSCDQTRPKPLPKLGITRVWSTRCDPVGCDLSHYEMASQIMNETGVTTPN